MTETDHLFSQKGKRGLTDDHLWFSVVTRPTRSRFTRIQRLSCCLCLLFTAMLANAMFYGQVATSSANGVTFGPFSLSVEQVRHTPASLLTDACTCSSRSNIHNSRDVYITRLHMSYSIYTSVA